MQNFLNKVDLIFQDLENNLKLKFARKETVPQHILFEDFFRCEKTARVLGLTFLKGSLTPLNKWTKISSKAMEVAIVFILLAEIFSFFMSAQLNLPYVMLDNALYCGCYVILAVKVFTIFYYNREKFDEVIEKLDEHFPHYGVD